MTQASVIDLPPVFDGIEAVCFDAFGTLVEITEKRGAVRQLFKAVPPGKRAELKHRLMREPRPIADWLEMYVADADPIMGLDVYARELSEVASVTIRPGMADIWALLRAKGLRLAVEPDRVLFVGDSLRADIEGLQAAGMRALHVDELVAMMLLNSDEIRGLPPSRTPIPRHHDTAIPHYTTPRYREAF